MNSAPNQANWYYVVDLDVRGPVSLEQISGLIAQRTLSETTMIAPKGSSQWRTAGLVLEEYRKAKLTFPDPPPPLPDALPPRNLLDQIGDTLSRVAGTEKLEGFSLKEMFSETFKKRTAAEMEQYLIVGTAGTTPNIAEVETGWPKPWLFARFLLLFGVIYLGFMAAFEQFKSANLVPSLILMGSFTMPVATLILFFELNTPRNISLYRLMVLVGLGGMVSVFISLLGYNVGRLNWLGASSAGIIEELAKLAALILIVRGPRYKYILNGLLFGAAVGAGFAAFESAGYAFRAILAHGSRAMIASLIVRGLLAPWMHVAWTAMVGAALWRVKQGQPLLLAHLANPKFFRLLIVAIVLHMLWNYPWEPPFYLKESLLGATAWFIIWGLVQQGLRQVRDEQRAALAVPEPAVQTAA